VGEPKVNNETEIEVTPDMIEAGLGPLLRFSRAEDLYEEAVRDIYSAMERARIYGKSVGAGGR